MRRVISRQCTWLEIGKEGGMGGRKRGGGLGERRGKSGGGLGKGKGEERGRLGKGEGGGEGETWEGERL